MEEAESHEADEEGSFDWLVKVHLPSRAAAADVAAKLAREGHSVRRRWRYVEIGAITDQRANELADRLRDELPPDAEIWVEANPDDLPSPLFVVLESRLRGDEG
jgi:hypothetical protein